MHSILTITSKLVEILKNTKTLDERYRTKPYEMALLKHDECQLYGLKIRSETTDIKILCLFRQRRDDPQQTEGRSKTQKGEEVRMVINKFNGGSQWWHIFVVLRYSHQEEPDD